MGLQVRRDGRQSILPFVIEQGQRADVSARAGLPLVVETMRALGVDEVAAAELPPAQRQRGVAPAHSNDLDASRKVYDAILGTLGYGPAMTDEKGRLFYPRC